MKIADLDVGSLPPTLDTAAVADLLGVNRETLYDAVRAGASPVTPLRLGRCLRWPTAAVLVLLGIDRGELPPGRGDGGGPPGSGPTTRNHTNSNIGDTNATASDCHSGEGR